MVVGFGSVVRVDHDPRGEGLELLPQYSKEVGVPLQIKGHELDVLGWGGGLK